LKTTKELTTEINSFENGLRLEVFKNNGY